MSKEMKLAYVSGPYRAKTIHEIKQNIRRAESLAIDLWKNGYAVICPHTNTRFFDGACEDDVWLAGDLVMLERCDVVVMLEGWENSEGAVIEHAHAQANSIEILYAEKNQAQPKEDFKKICIWCEKKIDTGTECAACRLLKMDVFNNAEMAEIMLNELKKERKHDKEKTIKEKSEETYGKTTGCEQAQLGEVPTCGCRSSAGTIKE